jgi:hypothetical protein
MICFAKPGLIEDLRKNDIRMSEDWSHEIWKLRNQQCWELLSGNSC